MIDTHSHINFEEYKPDFDNFITTLKKEGIENVIIPGVEPSTFDEIISYCEKYEMLYGLIGVHPSEYQTYNSDAERRIYELTEHKKIVGIGEIGLDYHYGPDTKKEQQYILRKQLKIAQEKQLPVVIHDRESHEDVFNILNEYKLKDVIFHCFSGNKEFALKCAEKGYYIAIGGIVTFKNAKDVKETVKVIPAENLLLETDAPYLAPVPYRGKLNTPLYLKYIAQEIAQLRGEAYSEISEKTTQNAKKVFKI